jgi:hypothetical protein
MAASAISWGVIGRWGDMVGVWIAPVTAQVIMTFLDVAMVSSSLYIFLVVSGWRETRGRRPFGPRRRIFLAANRFVLRKKMRQARNRVNIFEKSLNPAAGRMHQCV